MSKEKYPYLGTFIGQNGSMGFTTQQSYQLKITHSKPGDNILLESKEGYWCEYQSLTALLANWTLTGKVILVELNYQEITGFATPAELAAYEKGRADEEKVLVQWIKKWDGSTNSNLGSILKEKYLELRDKEIFGKKLKLPEIKPRFCRACQMLTAGVKFRRAPKHTCGL